MNLDEQSGDEDGDLSSLFTCETYVEKVFEFVNIEQPLLCSRSTCTDFDLTGQIVWPASIILCWYLAHHRDLLREKNVLELGAGCGLGGFFAANFSAHTTITDGNDVVLRLLEQNKEFLRDRQVQNGGPGRQIEIKKLLWGIKEEIRSIYGGVNAIPAPEVIIGADIVLWPLSVLPLVHTLRWLLSFHAHSSQAIISYVVRAHSTTELLLSTAAAHGLAVDAIRTHEQFLPNPVPENLAGLEKIVFRVRIMQPTGVSFESEPEQYPAMASDGGSGSAAVDDMATTYSTRTAAC